MKKNIFVVLLLIFCSFNGVSADQVSCERIQSLSWDTGRESWKTCRMDETTEINSTDTTIASRDESVQGLWLNGNKKVKFLLVGLSEKFPNLVGLIASQCSLTTISKANFKDLSKLRYLGLYYNQIEKINSDVFDDLVALEQLQFSYNKLKFINGKTFARLTKLTRIDLYSNQCINQDFNGASRIAVLQQTVDEKCSFDEELDEYVKKTFSIVSSLADKLHEQREECGNIAKALEAQAKSLLKALKDQQTFFNEALENKTIEIVDVKTQIVLKMSEIERQREELQRKNAEIIEKNEKIKKLEQKNEVLC